MAFAQVENVHGVPVVMRPVPKVPGVSAGLFYPAGSRWENSTEHGAAHFVEHLLFKGTKKHTCKELSRAVEGRGGDLNAFTGEETLCLHGRVPAGHGGRLISLLAEMALESTFPADEVERERGVITEEIRMMDDQPGVVAAEALNALLWPEQALGRPIAGTIASVGGIPRKGLMNYWQRRIQGVRPILVVAGGISAQEIREVAKKALARVGRETVAESTPAKRVSGRTFRSTAVAKPVAQVNVVLGIYAFGRKDPRRHCLRMLSVILGEAMSSRLFQRLREEEGLVYSVSTGAHLQKDDGVFYISAGLEPNNLAKAITMITEELQELARTGPGAAELKRARDYAMGQFALGLEGTSQQMFWTGDAMITRGKVVEPSEALARMEAVNLKGVKEVARELFQPGKVCVSAAGPEMSVTKVNQAAKSLARL